MLEPNLHPFPHLPLSGCGARKGSVSRGKREAGEILYSSLKWRTEQLQIQETATCVCFRTAPVTTYKGEKGLISQRQTKITWRNKTISPHFLKRIPFSHMLTLITHKFLIPFFNLWYVSQGSKFGMNYWKDKFSICCITKFVSYYRKGTQEHLTSFRSTL